MLLAALAGALLAWWSYRGRLSEPLARLAAFARLLAVTALLLLLVDPGFVGRAVGYRPVVLLDRSVSMLSAGGKSVEAATLAASLGDTITFGELSPGLPGGFSRLAQAVVATAASGRPLTVVTDGEIQDSSSITPEQLTGITVRLLPRTSGADIALVAVRSPQRLSSADSLTVEIDGRRIGGAADSARIEIRDGETLLLQGTMHFGTADRATLRLAGRLPSSIKGERWLVVKLVDGGDSEPGDDLRWLKLIVTPTPGIIVVATSPDWDAQALYRALRDVADAPVAGYAQLQPGRWFRMGDLRSATVAEVTSAARGADLLAVRGDVQAWKTYARARLLWPFAEEEGDWFLTGRPVSPVGEVFQGTTNDSLPPLPSAHAIDPATVTGWVGAVAKRSRRGAEVPVIGGVEGPNGRTIFFGIDGLARWGMRGGASEQVWRSLISASASWLLATRDADSAVTRPVTPVTQRGRPVHFRWIGVSAASTQAISLDDGQGSHVDSLRFDGAGEASLALPVGRYRYQLGGGGSGSFAVEPYSDELVPARVTLNEREATTSFSAPRRSWRELWWLFALTIAGFGAEWILRRRMGAR